MIQLGEGCKFVISWVGQCRHDTVKGSGYCKQHHDKKCCVCGAQATHDCSQTGIAVCGAPLCDNCEGYVDSDDGWCSRDFSNHKHRRIKALPEKEAKYVVVAMYTEEGKAALNTMGLMGMHKGVTSPVLNLKRATAIAKWWENHPTEVVNGPDGHTEYGRMFKDVKIIPYNEGKTL